MTHKIRDTIYYMILLEWKVTGCPLGVPISYMYFVIKYLKSSEL